MTGATINPGDPIENLAIGKIIEVDGPHIVAELDPQISELARVYAGEVYPIGQFGSIIKVHFGRVIIYGYVGRLRMKTEYEMSKGIPTASSSEGRVIEADLFGEGEWILSSGSTSTSWNLRFERGVSTYPLPQQSVYLTPTQELRFIYGHGKGATIRLGEHVGSGGRLATPTSTSCSGSIPRFLAQQAPGNLVLRRPFFTHFSNTAHLKSTAGGSPELLYSIRITNITQLFQRTAAFQLMRERSDFPIGS